MRASENRQNIFHLNPNKITAAAISAGSSFIRKEPFTSEATHSAAYKK